MGKYKKYIPELCVSLCLIFIILVFVPFVSSQNNYLALGLNDKKITKIEYVEYKDEPFRSVIKQKKEIIDNDELFNSFIKKANMQDVVLFGNPEYSKETLFIHFSDDTSINAFLDGDKIGFDYGKVWIRNNEASKIIKNMKDTKLVKKLDKIK